MPNPHTVPVTTPAASCLVCGAAAAALSPRGLCPACAAEWAALDAETLEQLCRGCRSNPALPDVAFCAWCVEALTPRQHAPAEFAPRPFTEAWWLEMADWAGCARRRTRNADWTEVSRRRTRRGCWAARRGLVEDYCAARAFRAERR